MLEGKKGASGRRRHRLGGGERQRGAARQAQAGAGRRAAAAARQHQPLPAPAAPAGDKPHAGRGNTAAAHRLCLAMHAARHGLGVAVYKPREAPL
jgi:hypothetical protein